jgi:Tfp pilus assembly protein PilP
MRALVFSSLIVLAAPSTTAAQGDAAMAAARAATGSQVGKPAAKSASPTAPAAATAAPAAVAPGTNGSATPAALAPQGFSYNAEGRRDPFVNLLRRGSGVDVSANTGPRPAGLKGLGAGEVTLRGTMASRGSFVGILQGSDARTYVVHQGERLFDGTIRSITADSLVILQEVNDPLTKQTHREVRKVLRHTEEAR